MDEKLHVDSLDDFVKLLAAWHLNKVKVLEHLTKIPEGTEVTIDDDEDDSVTLKGDLLIGFKLGIEVALMELGHLPFQAEYEVDEAEPA